MDPHGINIYVVVVFLSLIKTGGRPFGYVVISGMKHYEDHEIIAEAMAEQLHVDIPKITKTER